MKNHVQTWHPSYWLAALGAGGLSISFFMYLMWLVPHDGFPMPTWEHLQAVFSKTQATSTGVQTIVILATVLMLVLGILHFILLVWNIRAHKTAKQQSDYAFWITTAAQVQLMSRPLTFAMTINVCFALGVALIPNLWKIVNYLFPFALIAFILIGIWSLLIYGSYISRFLITGGFQQTEHNHLSPLIAVFTFSMISVGFAAPAAMSDHAGLASIAATLSILFLMLAVIVGLLVLITGWQAMLQHGLQTQATPSIWMLIPILTLLGIEWLRLQHGLSNHFERPIESSHLFIVLTALFMLQIGILLLGFRIMYLNGYLSSQLGNKQAGNPISFGLVCPGVALVVLGIFWWHVAWVNTGILTAYSVTYWVGIAFFASVQFLTLTALLRLTQRLFLHKKVIIPS